jgi:tetratricopeptide (TPR) repeat protein
MCTSLRAITLVALVTAVASATPARADNVTEAREHFRLGSKLYDLQRYDEAALEYERAYVLKEDPALLFNIGQAYRFAGSPAKAIGAYRAYLRRTPRAPNRAEVEARIAEMQRVLDEQQARQALEQSHPEEAKPPAVAPTPAPTTSAPAPAPIVAERKQPLKLAGIITAAGGLALVATGAALEGVAHSEADQFNRPATGAVFDSGAESRIKTFETTGWVLIGVGAAALVGGAALVVLGVRQDRAARRAAARHPLRFAAGGSY